MAHLAATMTAALPIAVVPRSQASPPVLRCSVRDCPKWAACNGLDRTSPAAPIGYGAVPDEPR